MYARNSYDWIISHSYRFYQPNNPLAHEFTTGPEIIEDIVNEPLSSRPSTRRVDAIVAGAGTGGTITGISRAIKGKHNPQAIIVGVDPVSGLYCL